MAVDGASAVPTAILLAIQLAAAGAGSTTIDAMSTSVNASTRVVTVSGDASFGEAPVKVGEDPVGDNAGGTSAGAVGLDIDGLYISQPTDDTDALLFTISLQDLAGGGLPDSIQYNWDIAVDGGDTAGGSSWSIRSSRTSQYYQAGSVEPYAGIFRCVRDQTTGVYSCSERSSAVATYDPGASEIRIVVPLTQLQAEAASSIAAWPRNGDPVWVRPAALGAVTPGVTIDGATHDPYDVPVRKVRLGVAPPGTPEGSVNFSKVAAVSGSGSFSGTVTAPTLGNWDVWARACFGASCDARAVRVRV